MAAEQVAWLGIHRKPMDANRAFLHPQSRRRLCAWGESTANDIRQRPAHGHSSSCCGLPLHFRHFFYTANGWVGGCPQRRGHRPRPSARHLDLCSQTCNARRQQRRASFGERNDLRSGVCRQRQKALRCGCFLNIGLQRLRPAPAASPLHQTDIGGLAIQCRGAGAS